jgi:E3 ubiquitin-protein ligase ZNF598
MVEEHGAAMSARDRKDARRVQADFEFEEVGGRGRGRRNQEREPPPHQQPQPPPPPAPGPSRPPGGSRRRDFGTTLTAEGGNPNPGDSLGNTPGPSRRQSPSPIRGDDDVDPQVFECVVRLSCGMSH